MSKIKLDMKLIPLTQGKFAQVDDEDYDFLMQWKWCAVANGNSTYVARSYRISGKTIKVLMHRLILGLTDPKIFCDHKDINGLNNKKSNLRQCTHEENIRNRGIQANNTTGFKGVSLITSKYKDKVYLYWAARIKISGKCQHLGMFKTKEEAALVYNKHALSNYGEFANLNVV